MFSNQKIERVKWVAGFFTRGIILEQRKEPALRRKLRTFFNANYAGMLFESDLPCDGAALAGEQIIEIARLARIVDERDGVLLHEKLEKARQMGIQVVVGDAIDDEPYVSSQMNPMLFLPTEAAEGLRLAAKAVGNPKIYFAVYKNLNDMDLKTKIPKDINGVEIRRIHGRYPAEIRTMDTFDKDGSAMLVGVCSLIHLYRAVYEHRLQSTCFVTVAGDCVANPMNLEVSIGMTPTQLFERCGLAEDPGYVVIGGSMTGTVCEDPDSYPVGTMSRAVLALRDEEKKRRYQCIGCGRCVEVCPESLTPFYINRYIELGKLEELAFYDMHRCIGCGTCSYVCPAKVDIADNIKTARAEIERRRPVAKEAD